MEHTPLTAASIASSALELSKTAWDLGVFVSKLDYNAQVIDQTIKNLANQVKSLRLVSDDLYCELEPICKTDHRTTPRNGLENTIWHYVVAPLDETRQTMQELGFLVQTIVNEESNSNITEHSQRHLSRSRYHLTTMSSRICRHGIVMRTILLLIVAYDSSIIGV